MVRDGGLLQTHTQGISLAQSSFFSPPMKGVGEATQRAGEPQRGNEGSRERMAEPEGEVRLSECNGDLRGGWRPQRGDGDFQKGMKTSARSSKGEVGASRRGLERGRGCSEGNRGSVEEQKLSEGRQGPGERGEGWRLGEGTWLDSGPSSKFGSSQGRF